MSRQVGSLHRSNSHPANLQNPPPIIPLFAFPRLDSPQANISSGINSDTNSDSQFKQQFHDSIILILKPPMSSPIPNHPLLHIPRPAQPSFQNPLSDLSKPKANIHLPTLLLK